MSSTITNVKIKLPTRLVQQIRSVSKDPVEKVIQDAISHYIATYASETVIAESVARYISSTEKLFEENFDKLTNLMASLSYVSKFNNNILNAIFINYGGKDDELERLYNEATETVQKYFYFEDNDEAVLPIMEENDQLKLKVQQLEKLKEKEEEKQSAPQQQQASSLLKSPKSQQTEQGARHVDSEKNLQKQLKKVQHEKEKLEVQKKELIEWINGLILYVVQNYSHFRRNEKLLREYIKEHPKPQV